MSQPDVNFREVLQPVRDYIHESCVQREAELKRQLDEALTVLAPANPEETLIGAIRNLQQAHLSADENCEVLEAKLAEATICDICHGKGYWISKEGANITCDCLIREERALNEFSPTAACINRLPAGVRRYIHDLESRCDPAGDLQHIAFLTQTVAGFERKLAEAQAETRRAHEHFSGFYNRVHTALGTAGASANAIEHITALKATLAQARVALGETGTDWPPQTRLLTWAKDLEAIQYPQVPAYLRRLVTALTALDAGPDFNQEVNLHADTIAERFDAGKEDPLATAPDEGHPYIFPEDVLGG